MLKVKMKQSGGPSAFQRIYYENVAIGSNELRGVAPIDLLRKYIPSGQGLALIFEADAVVLSSTADAKLNGEKLDTAQLLPGHTYALEIGTLEFEVEVTHR